MDETYKKGHEGILSVYDTAAYKPLACLTATNYSRAVREIEKVNYCTLGKTKTTSDGLDRTISFNGEVVEITDGDAKATYEDLDKSIEAQEDLYWKLEGRGDVKYFKGLLRTLNDSFTAGEDATFDGEIRVNEKYDEDPKV